MVALQLDPVISSGVVDHNAYLYQFLVFQFFVQTDKPTQRHTYIERLKTTPASLAHK